MQRLIEGIHRFPRETFGHSRELFDRPSRHGPQPLTLLITPIQDLVRSRYAHLIDDAVRQHVAELESVLLSLENLPTHPCGQEQLNRGALHPHGWFFKTATRELFACEPATGQFEPLMALGDGRHA